MGKLKTLSSRYVSTLIPVILLISVAFNFHLGRIYSKKDLENNYLINLSGRQRMLSQQVLVDIFKAQKENSSIPRDHYQRFQDSARTLLYGGEITYDYEHVVTVKIPPAPTREIADLLSKQIILMNQLFTKASYRDNSPAYQEEIMALNREVLDTANLAVEKYDLVSHQEIIEKATLRKYLFILNIFLSLLTAAVLIRHIKLTSSMKAANDKILKVTKSKTNFFASVSHEIRNPLNVVTAMPDLLQATPLTPEQAKYVDTLRHTSNRLLNLINDLLDFSRLETGNVPLQIETFEVLPFIKRIAAAAQIKADEKDLRFELNFDINTPKFLKGDSLRIGQVLDNFISNAIRFTDVGVVKLWVKRLEPHNARERIFFEVSDTGTGIDQEDMGRLFDPFVQVGKPLQEKRGGTGLGLSIAQQIVRAMGGQIRVDSRKDFGSRFSFILELERGKPVELQNEKPVLKDKSEEVKILCVDDSVDNLMVVSGLLSPFANYKVSHASGGELALSKVKSENFDLILMDIQMPIMDGVDAARRIQTWQLSHNKSLTPIVALTAGTNKDLSNFVCRLDKPINQNSLLETINNVL